jgi:hypothetical protein
MAIDACAYNADLPSFGQNPIDGLERTPENRMESYCDVQTVAGSRE